jgi:hypothetical protein
VFYGQLRLTLWLFTLKIPSAAIACASAVPLLLKENQRSSQTLLSGAELTQGAARDAEAIQVLPGDCWRDSQHQTPHRRHACWMHPSESKLHNIHSKSLFLGGGAMHAEVKFLASRFLECVCFSLMRKFLLVQVFLGPPWHSLPLAQWVNYSSFAIFLELAAIRCAETS